MRSPFTLIAVIICLAAAGYFASPIVFGKDLPRTTEITTSITQRSQSTSQQKSSKTTAHSKNNTKTTPQRKSHNTASKKLLELPTTHKGETIISHTGFTLSYDREHNVPRWVAWQLTKAETEGTIPRAKDFLPDPSIEARHRVTSDDYKNSGYDRGHMVPAADMHWSARAMTECFYMTNICPQSRNLNSGSWATLEKACRRWAKQEGAVYIVCGPIYDTNRRAKRIGLQHKISVPNKFFKVVLSTRKGKEKAIGFIYNNRDGQQPMSQTACTVDRVEAITGLDFFADLDDRLEKRIEATADLKSWR